MACAVADGPRWLVATAPVGSGTTSDWAFLGDIPTVKVGPGDTFRSHRPNEHITLAEIEAGAAFYQQLATLFFALQVPHE